RDRLARAGVPPALLGVGAGVVAVAPRLVLAGVRRRHGAAARHAAQQALEQEAELVADRRPAAAAVAQQRRLHLPPRLGLDTRLVLAVVQLGPVLPLAGVGGVGQVVVQRRLRERPPAALLALARRPALGRPVAPPQLLHHRQQGLVLEVQGEDA